MADEPEPFEERSDEMLEVRRRRYKEARRAGFSFVEARLFAESDQDVGLLRRLVAKGCPAHLLAPILIGRPECPLSEEEPFESQVRP